MRPMTLSNLHPTTSDSHANLLRFGGGLGEVFQLTVLDHDMLRVQHYPSGAPQLDRTWLVVGKDGDVPLEGRPRADLSPFALPSYTLQQGEQTWQIGTDSLRIDLHLQDAHLEWYTRDGVRFAADLPKRAYTYDRAGRSFWHYQERRTDEHYFGFGERAGKLDKHGMRLEMRNLDALGYNAETSDPLYKHVPFYITHIPSLNIAYGLFYDNLATTIFDMGKEIDAFWGFYRYMQAHDGDLDYTLIYGPTIEAVIEKYTRLTGKPALMPRWALGFLGSTMSYTEAPDAQERLKQFVELCQQHDLPCDLFHLSSGYTTDDEGRRNVFTWNRQRVPQPEQMVQTFHEAGIRLAANIKPYLLTTHPHYGEVAAAGGFIREGDSDAPAHSRFWSGGAFASGEGGYIDFTSAAGFDWWQQHLKTALLDYGIDAAWNDNNEYELWDDEALCAGRGKPLRMALARPLQTLLMARASYEALKEHAPHLRPFVLSRSGCSGIQRYVQTWSGDNETSWHTLRYNIPMGLGMSLSGIPNTGHDVGGFFGPAPDPELFVRWVQCGIFHPRFTIHSWNTDGSVNEPWMYPDMLPLVRDLFRLRYRLLPYLYTLAFEAHTTGHPIIRPLVYHFPHDQRCQTESFDFLLGSHLLVAPVLEPGARSRRVYLPAGTRWYDFHTGEWHAGGREIEVAAPLERIPLFVADGGVLPLGGDMHYVGEKTDDQRDVHIFARDSAAFTLIEDDGISIDYLRGGYTEVLVTAQRATGGWQVRAERQHGGYTLPYTHINVTLHTPDDLPLAGGAQVQVL
jgi:alpha-glucosidase